MDDPLASVELEIAVEDFDTFREVAPRTRAILRRQLEQIKGTDHQFVTCNCGRHPAVFRSYKCLYCGVFLCPECAEIHFGQTRAEYDQKHAAQG